MDGHFLYSVVYKDEIFYNLVGAAGEVLGILIFYCKWFEPRSIGSLSSVIVRVSVAGSQKNCCC